MRSASASPSRIATTDEIDAKAGEAERKPPIKVLTAPDTDPGGITGTAEIGTAKDSDFQLRETPDGWALGFRLVSDKGGIKVIARDAMAQGLAASVGETVGKRVTVWGRIKDEEFTPKGARRKIKYQVLDARAHQDARVRAARDGRSGAGSVGARMRRITTAITGAVLLAVIVAGVALAAMYEQAASGEVKACANIVTSSGGPNACFGETSTSGWPAGDLFILTNGTDVADLTNVYYGLIGKGGTDSRCDRTLTVDWNDCLTDVVVRLPYHTCFRAYTDEEYHGERVWAASNNKTSGTKIYHFGALGSLNNTVSSARLYNC